MAQRDNHDRHAGSVNKGISVSPTPFLLSFCSKLKQGRAETSRQALPDLVN